MSLHLLKHNWDVSSCPAPSFGWDGPCLCFHSALRIPFSYHSLYSYLSLLGGRKLTPLYFLASVPSRVISKSSMLRGYLIHQCMKKKKQQKTQEVRTCNYCYRSLDREGFPGGTVVKEPTCHFRRRKRHGFDPWVGKIRWRRKWQPTPGFLPEKPHGQRSLAGYSPWIRRAKQDLVKTEPTLMHP